ncbi:MAG: hypothetical protein FJ276_16060, partial [Planctomycetes bacterium]|nr:hypothetical protein [Planctomycetota bacterium]
MQRTRTKSFRACAVLVILGMLVLPRLSAATTATESEMATVQEWCAAHLGESAESIPSFSFTCGGKPSVGLLSAWRRARAVREIDGVRREITVTWTDPATGLVVRCVAIAYADSPVVEWTMVFRNSGQQDTAVLADILPLDVSWQRGGEGEYLLRHAVGSPANGSDYGPLETPLGPRATKRVGAAGGRPTNSDLCYFNLDGGAAGTIVGVGWPGQWVAEFARDDEKGIRVRAGQELTHFKLLP